VGLGDVEPFGVSVEQRPIASSAALLTVARLSSAAALFGVTVIAARLLTAEQVGSAAVGQVIGTLAALVANGGLNISSIYFLRRRPDEERSLVSGLTALAIAACVLAVALAVATAPVVFGPVFGATNWPLLVTAGFLGASVIAYEFTGALLLAFGDSRRFVLLEVVRGWGSLAFAAAIVVAVRADFGLVLGLALGFVAASLVGIGRVGRRVPLQPRFDPTLSREALGFGVRGQVGNVLQFLGVRLDLLLVPVLLDLELTGLYYVAVRVSDLVGQAATASASFLFPHVAGQAAQRDAAMTERVTRVTLLVTIIAAVAIAIGAGPLLEIAFGEAYAAATAVLLVMLVAVVPLSIGRLVSADLKGRGLPGTVSVGAAVSLVATVVLDLALIPGFGILGAAVASLVAYSLLAVTLLVAYRAATDGSLMALVPRPSDLRDLRTLVDPRVSRRSSTDR
jgi:stage V sporulation protein B